MRLRTLGLATLLASSLYSQSNAVVRPKGAEPPVVAAAQGGRMYRSIAWAGANHTASRGLTGWIGQWDRDTDVPLRLWGEGIAHAGSMASPAIAEAAARAFLAQHIATLAPGSTVSDFELAANQLDGDIRSVGFIQRSNGIRVLGGGIGFAFKNDRLVMISSTALPHVNVVAPMKRFARSEVASIASQWLATAGHLTVAKAEANAAALEPVIYPTVRPRINGQSSISYRVAEQVALQATDSVGAWSVWIDAASGSPIARSSTIHWGSGRVLFNVPDRGPHATRTAKPAALARHTVNGVATDADADGKVTWNGTAAATVAVKISGAVVAVVNAAGTGAITDTLTLANNGSATLSKATVEFADAQLNAYVHANIAKDFAKTRLNPTLPWLGQQIQVNVNENDSCNAFSTGDDIHFFRANNQCENTGRLADVVYHEFGHSLHGNSIIEGVGAFDGALSEGMSDVLAMAITGDPGMGRGFFKNDSPLRNLDPARDLKWPDDVQGESHADGEIIGGTMWDLRVALETKLGATAGYNQFLKLMYVQFQRAHDIPSTYAEALLADDNDGNLANGTPNMCEINAVFGRHGLADPTAGLGIETPITDDLHVSAAVASGAPVCPNSPTISKATLTWKPRAGGAGGDVAMTLAAGKYEADIPAPADGTVIQYKVTFTLSDGSSVSYPQNPADPLYELYHGPVTTIKCFDFEGADGAAGWVTSNDWEIAAPAGLANDPSAAFAGTNAFGMDLTQDGAYDPSDNSTATSPEIDLKGNKKVRLQFRRWLSVEDGVFDDARITVNGTAVWSNFASQNQNGGVNHIDREWRFQDVDLSAAAATGKLKIGFTLASDQGLELGGWTIDDVCIVAEGAPGPDALCGNNMDDTGEECDDGNKVDGDGCSATCKLEGDGSGCCSTGSGPQGALALSALTAGVLLRRRRRAA